MKTDSKSADVRIRIEPGLKEDAVKVLAQCGLTVSDAFRLFLRQVVATQGLPFPIMVPNATTLAAMNEARSMQAGRFASAKDLLDDLEKDAPGKAGEGASTQ